MVSSFLCDLEYGVSLIYNFYTREKKKASVVSFFCSDRFPSSFQTCSEISCKDCTRCRTVKLSLGNFFRLADDVFEKILRNEPTISPALEILSNNQDSIDYISMFTEGTMHHIKNKVRLVIKHVTFRL